MEVKFEGDRIDPEQLKQYRQLINYAAEVKTKASPVRHQQKNVSIGGRLSLFRYPEDVADGHGKDGRDRQSGKKPNRKHD